MNPYHRVTPRSGYAQRVNQFAYSAPSRTPRARPQPPRQPTAVPFQLFNLQVGATTSVQALPNQPFRRYILIQNRGGSPLWVGFDVTPSSTEGIVLLAGESYEPLTAVPSNAINLLSSSGTLSVRVLVG